MKIRQRGVSLVVALVLLTVALVLGLSSVQSTRLQEAMTGNFRSIDLSHMAAETGSSKFYVWLKGQSSWPSNDGDVDPWEVGYGETVGTHARFELDDICWGSPTNDPDVCSDDFSSEHVTVWMKGLASNDSAVSNVVSLYQKMPPPPTSAAYTCFGPWCSDTVSGNAELTGEDYNVPVVFDCEGNACVAGPSGNGEEYDAYYPGIPLGEHPAETECTEFDTDGLSWTSCDGTYYGVNDAYDAQDQWYGFLNYIEGVGFDVVLREGDELDYNVGGRDDYNPDSDLDASGFWDSITPKFVNIENGSEVTVQKSTNTLGVIVVRDGATLDYKGTSTHEGIILVEPGGTLKFSSGNPQVYGGIVALESVMDNGEVITGGIEISGNMGVHYSSIAWSMISQDGKGVQLRAWYDDVSL